MKNLRLLTLALICVFYACQTSEIDLGIATNYLPSSQLLQNGVVNKYYTHFQKTGSTNISTHIAYRSYQAKSNKLFHNYYKPDYSKEVSKEFSFQDNQMLLLEELRFHKGIDIDTFKTTISKPLVKDWKEQKCNSEKTVHYNLRAMEWKVFQENNRDTIVLERPAKIFEGHQNYTITWKGDTTIMNRHFKEIYVEGLGLFYNETTDENGKSWMELVEQIPLKAFQKQAEHGLHRIAYIDPEKTLDKGTPFKLCKTNNQIYDYYNGQQILHYKGGKKAIWKIVHQELHKEKLMNESGYLTFRFIVNCEGEKGRFITEQADLNFQKKQFNQTTINHCYDILQKANDWIPTKIRGKNVDAYFYLTFKLKEGQLIELLP